MIELNKKGTVGPVGAMLAGAALGAAAVVLSNKQTRKNIQKTIEGVKKNSQDKIKKLQDRAENLTEDAQGRLSETLDQAKEKVNKKSASKKSA